MIREIAQLQDTNFMSNEEIEKVVNSVVTSVGTSALDFEKASEMYNIDFFRGEGVEFAKRLATALINQFPKFTNLYWVKLAGPMIPAVVEEDLEPIIPESESEETEKDKMLELQVQPNEPTTAEMISDQTTP